MFDIFYIGRKPGLFVHEREVDSIQHACELSRTRYCWIVTYLADYSKWDWLWEPVPWQANQRHAWASQWQKDSGTYLVPKAGYTETNYHSEQIIMQADMSLWENTNSVEQFDFSWHPDYTDPLFNYEFGTQWQKTGGPRYPVVGATEIKYVSQSGSTVRAQTSTVYVIDHLDDNAAEVSNEIHTQVSNKILVRYFDNYLDTLKRIGRNAHNNNQEFVWICSSVCNYSNFDFSWHPEAWQNHMLHVFPSSGEKFGDTFFMHVPTFISKIDQYELLEWYDLNFVTTVDVPRRPIPVIDHKFDTHVEAVKKLNWTGPLALFNTGIQITNTPVVPLWREKTKTVTPLSLGASAVIVPRTAISYIDTQLYDYPYIDKTHQIFKDQDMDVVFISNGESIAQDNWQQLLSICPRAKHSQGVTGREAAYKAAARLSTTPWFFAVFAKTEVLPDFDFSYQPDRIQQAKHYIFHSRNPLNGLEYGSMNINLYNVQLTLETIPGIDFTLSSAHEVVPICASVSRFNTDPWVTWRSAFREVLKLKREVDLGADVEIQYRLDIWCTRAEGQNAEYCLRGAHDALKYYNTVHGDYEKLCLSFDWAWLQDYYYSLYQTEPWLKSV